MTLPVAVDMCDVVCHYYNRDGSRPSGTVTLTATAEQVYTAGSAVLLQKKPIELTVTEGEFDPVSPKVPSDTDTDLHPSTAQYKIVEDFGADGTATFYATAVTGSALNLAILDRTNGTPPTGGGVNYVTVASVGAPNGVAGLDADSKLKIVNIPDITVQITGGDDGQVLTRTASSAEWADPADGGGTATISPDAGNAIDDRPNGIYVPTVSTTGLVATTDTRLANARTPTAHAASHAVAGADRVTPAAIGAIANPAVVDDGQVLVWDVPTSTVAGATALLDPTGSRALLLAAIEPVIYRNETTGVYPLRITVTTSATKPVKWSGTQAPTIGSGYAIDGVDYFRKILA